MQNEDTCVVVVFTRVRLTLLILVQQSIRIPGTNKEGREKLRLSSCFRRLTFSALFHGD